jgi:hypothetical protein
VEKILKIGIFAVGFLPVGLQKCFLPGTEQKNIKIRPDFLKVRIGNERVSFYSPALSTVVSRNPTMHYGNRPGLIYLATRSRTAHPSLL